MPVEDCGVSRGLSSQWRGLQAALTAGRFLMLWCEPCNGFHDIPLVFKSNPTVAYKFGSFGKARGQHNLVYGFRSQKELHSVPQVIIYQLGKPG